MDTRLLALRASLCLGDGGFYDTDPPVHNVNWATGWKVKMMCELLPMLYISNPNSRKNARSSYGLKHELEHLFQTYAPELSSLHTNWVGNGELILAMAYCGFHSHSRCGLNAFYYLKDKRRGKNNKGGMAKKEAECVEALVRDFLRKKVEEHLGKPSGEHLGKPSGEQLSASTQ